MAVHSLEGAEALRGRRGPHTLTGGRLVHKAQIQFRHSRECGRPGLGSPPAPSGGVAACSSLHGGMTWGLNTVPMPTSAPEAGTLP